MKRSMIKPIAICLCMILLVSSSVAAFSLTNEKKEEAEQPVSYTHLTLPTSLSV